MRPSTYKPEYCEELVAHALKGGTFSSFAGVIGVHRDTITDWRKAFPEFDEAADIANNKALALAEYAHWELAAKGGKTAGLEFRMKNLSRFETWKHVERQELTGPDGGPVQSTQRIERVIVDPQN